MCVKKHRVFAGGILPALIITLLFAVQAMALDADLVSEIYYRAMAGGRPVPILDFADGDKTETNAYRIQTLLVEKLLAHSNDTIAGYKAGLTTNAQMQRFGAPAPVMGPLFGSGLAETLYSQKIKITSFPGIMLENEFAFKTAKPITVPVKDVAELKEIIASVHPAIEIPQLNFSDMSRLGYFDLTAACVGSKMFIVGPAHSTDADLDSMKIVMTRDGVVVNEGTGDEVLGGQWQSLLRLINDALRQSGRIEAGQYFLTGALGKMIPAAVGKYRAEYPFGTLIFTVEERTGR